MRWYSEKETREKEKATAASKHKKQTIVGIIILVLAVGAMITATVVSINSAKVQEQKDEEQEILRARLNGEYYVNGTKYVLGEDNTLSVFLDNGYGIYATTMSDDTVMELKPRTYTNICISSNPRSDNSKYGIITVANDTDEVRSLYDCSVYGIDIVTSLDTCKVTLPYDIALKTNDKSNLLDTFGDPDSIEEVSGENSEELRYNTPSADLHNQGAYVATRIMCSKDDGTVKRISYANGAYLDYMLA